MRLQDTTDRISDYSTRLVKCFPDHLGDDVKKVLSILYLDKLDLIHSHFYTVRMQDKTIVMPYRLYFSEPDENRERELNDEQRTILNCIFLRHCDGYLRQRRLEKLLGQTQNFIVPFTFQLLGEYVREILVVLDNHINDKTIKGYLNFIELNKDYFKQTESRMISYWDCYYRREYPNKREYIGAQIFGRLKKELPKQNDL